MPVRGTLARAGQGVRAPPRHLQLHRRRPGRRHHPQALPVALRRISPPISPPMGFRIYRASHDDYEDSFYPTGSPVGTCEDALDTACGLYLGDPTAWT